jgi:N6-adenosine-specific RNA methylase IME4
MSFTRTATDLDALVASGDKFGCIYADPPWKYDDQGVRGAAAKHYDCMTVDEICALPIRDLAADDAHLHLWVTNAFLFDAFRIFDAWDFSFRSTFAWCKPTMGIGHYWRNSHELMLTAIRGNDDGFNAHEMLRSWAIMPRGKHSSKPERVRHMIERASKGPYLELFGRWPTQGWTVWGNEIERTLFSPADNESEEAEAKRQRIEAEAG